MKTSSMFENGEFTITGGNFLHNEGSGTQNLIQLQNYAGEPGIDRLLNHIANEATHNSHERYPFPSCHQGTRNRILDHIRIWIHASHSETRILWLSGTVGVGKTAIMQEIANLMLHPTGPVAASFFFGRGKGKRELGEYLFPTIAHQLTINIPELRGPINDILHHNPSLLMKTLERQFHALIIDPLSRIRGVAPRVVIIEGLDECRDQSIQILIVKLIGEVVQDVSLPLRFMIASRPEPQLTDAFDQPLVRIKTHHIVLDEDSFQTSEDIRQYLRDKFNNIADQRRYGRLFRKTKKPWPGEEVIDQLVQRADGQFIYAATVIKFVDDHNFLPTDQLQLILDHQYPLHTFSALDDLYTQILSTHPEPATLLRILGFAIILQDSTDSLQVLGDVLGMDQDELEAKLCRLHPVLKIQHSQDSDRTAITFVHASFTDYLEDQRRSGQFTISTQKFSGLLCMKFLSEWSGEVIRKIFPKSRPAHSDFKRRLSDSTRELTVGSCFVGFAHVDAESMESLLSIARNFRYEWNTKRPLLDSPVAPRSPLLTTLQLLKTIAAPASGLLSPYMDALHHCLNLSWSIPGGLNDLVAFVPAILAVHPSQTLASPAAVAAYLNANESSLSSFLHQNLDVMDQRSDMGVPSFNLHPIVISFVSSKVTRTLCCRYLYHFEHIGQLLGRIFPPDLSGFNSPFGDSEESELTDMNDWSYGIKAFETFLWEEFRSIESSMVCTAHILALLDLIKSIVYPPNLLDFETISYNKIAHLWAGTGAMLQWLVTARIGNQGPVDSQAEIWEIRKKAAKNIFDQVLTLEGSLNSPRVVCLRQPFEKYLAISQVRQIRGKNRDDEIDWVEEFDDFLDSYPQESGLDIADGRPPRIAKDLLFLGVFTKCGFGDYLTSPDAGRFYIGSRETLVAQVLDVQEKQVFRHRSKNMNRKDQAQDIRQSNEELNDILQIYGHEPEAGADMDDASSTCVGPFRFSIYDAAIAVNPGT